MKHHPTLTMVSSAGMRLGIDRFMSFIQYLGNPIAHFPMIHVAGTNGKGSVVRILESCLSHGGYRVGSYISPHLEDINERICVGQKMISDEELGPLIEYCHSAAKTWSNEVLGIKEDIPLTHFELLTACAFVYFSREKVDLAIIEVGLGGRYDATNIIQPLVGVIASISLDHMDILGSDEASIAAEKSGIIKENLPMVVGNVSQEALRTIRSIALEKSSALYVLGSNINIHSSDLGIEVRVVDRNYPDCCVQLLGGHQAENVAISIAALQVIENYFPVPLTTIQKALRNIVYPGRMEWLQDNVLIDCAHNEAGAKQLGSYLMSLEHEKERILVFGLSRDKDLRNIIMSIVGQVDRVYVFSSAHERALSTTYLQSQLEALRIEAAIIENFEEVLPFLSKDHMLIVTGSIFLVGEFRSWFHLRFGSRQNLL